LSRLLAPLVPLYAAAVGAKNAAYARGWARPKRLGWPVISIGNLSVGGSGKTPLTIRLAALLRERGLAVDVLSRGYGRRSKAVVRVDPNGSAEEFGDEPLLIAREAGVPVFVGGNRHAAGLLAEARSAVPGVHLLDDGFQHRQLARNADIVVLHRTDFEERLLPAGRLRERLDALVRAHVLVLREEDRGLEGMLRRRGLQQPIWWMERRLEIPQVRRAVAFCAIARQEEFFSGLKEQGVAVAGTRSWRDHHEFTRADVFELTELQRQQEADAFLTTAKDLVRLSADQRCELEKAAPIHAVQLRVRLSDEAAAIDELLSLLPGPWRAGGARLSQTP
jgi:tetraacyldisaccharide 4'-kinase